MGCWGSKCLLGGIGLIDYARCVETMIVWLRSGEAMTYESVAKSAGIAGRREGKTEKCLSR